MISGGSPSPPDVGYLDSVYEHILRNSPLPVDVMFTQRPDDMWIAWPTGALGYSINLEIYDAELAAQIMPQKHRRSLKLLAQNLERALARVGGAGRYGRSSWWGLSRRNLRYRGSNFWPNWAAIRS